ncbi:MAG: helix-turn-helix domain-containing protein [Vicinamibacterales bacterium]
MIQAETFAPSPPLADFVRAYVSLCGSPPDGRYVRPIIARPDVVIAFNLARRHQAFEYRTGAPRLLPSALIVGPQTSRRADLWFDTPWASFTISLQPAAFQRLFHLPIQPFLDRALDAYDVLGHELAVLHDRLREAPDAAARVRLVEAFLLQRIPAAGPSHPATAAASALLTSAGRLSVRGAAQVAGLSERHLERAFGEWMGVPPKLYARIVRLNYVLRLKAQRPELTWAAISHDAGYFDQTHLVKDFKAMVGEAPGTYMRRSAPADGGFLLSSTPAHP